MEFDVNAVVVAIIAAGVAIVGAVIWGLSQIAKQGKNDVPRLTQSLLERMPTFIQEAAKYAALFIEKMDENGQLQNLIGEYANKADAKLDSATDIAVAKVEDWIQELLERLNIHDVVVDIPEQTIKDYIQKYVWENPDLFPQRGKEIEIAQEQKVARELEAIEQRKRETKQPANYPANLYKKE